MTLITPILMGLLLLAPTYLSSVSQDMDQVKHIAFIEQEDLFSDGLKNSEYINFTKIPTSEVVEIKKDFENSPYFALIDLLDFENKINIYSDQQISFSTIKEIERKIQSIIEEKNYKDGGIDIEHLKSLSPKIDIDTIIVDEKGEETNSNSAVRSGIGFLFGFLIYLFIFMYGSMVMRGVIEEKTNRIVEVIVSSVKPFQLLIGKIVGVALVGLTQFILWILLVIVIISIAEMSLFDSQNGTFSSIMSMTQGVEISGLLLYFIFYFIGGYLLYGSFFACIGSAVDNESDTHQMILPITIPLILSLVMIESIINNPDGTLAFWLSIFPLSSPIIMMVRLPFESVELWEVLLSAFLLITSFLFSTWISSRIYRIGILMYGKKSTFRELLKWIKYKG